MSELSLTLPDVMGSHHLGLAGYGQKSKGYQTLIRDIGTAKTKHEEDQIIRKELVSLRHHLISSQLSAKQIRELLIRMIYCETLGHDASFGYINAIKYAERSAILEKKTGYLAASIFLNKSHSLVCLLINTIQKDLKSTNVVAKSTVLSIICNLVDAEKVPPLLPFVIAALKDKRVEIRKKAMLTLKHVHKLNEDLVPNIDEYLRSAISDRDPVVVHGALQFFHTLIKENPSKYRGYLKVFLQVLTQVVEGKLTEFGFHGVQAPWMQIKLLNILALLGHQNKSSTESMSAVLSNVMSSLPTDCNIGCAVMFECIKTITTIYPLKLFLDLAAKKTTLFLTSNSSNLKCLGITAMTALVEVETSYAGDDKLQQVIIECLDDEDRTIGKKILELLYKITNSENIGVVCPRLLDYIRSSTEQAIKSEVARNLTRLANQYAPNITWYVNTINDVMQVTDNFDQADVIHSLIKAIAAGDSEDQRVIATRYLEQIKRPTLRDNLVQVASWVLGEYANLIAEDYSLKGVLSQLIALLNRNFEDATTYGWIMTAIAKLTRHMGVYLPETRGIMDRYRSGFAAELRQRCHELHILASDVSLMKNALSLNSAEEDFKVCPSLSFLDNFVAQALTAGARPYQQNFSNVQETSETKTAPPELRFEPYEVPFSRLAVLLDEETPKIESSSVQLSTPQTATSHKEEKLTKPRTEPGHRPVWGPSGYTGNKIRKSSESPDNVTHSSSKHSSSQDFDSPSQQCDDTTRNVEVIERSESPISHPSTSFQSPGNRLFAGVKSKKRVETSRAIKRSPNENFNSKDTTSSEGAPDIPSVESLEQILTEKLDLGFEEQKIEEAINPGQAAHTAESDFEKEAKRSRDTLVSASETDLLFDSIGSDISSESIRHHVKVEESKTASLLEENQEVPRKEKTIDDILDSDIVITGDLAKLENIGPSSVELARNDLESKELCIDSNVRLVTSVVRRPSELVVLMKLTNHNQSRVAVEKISLVMEPPSNLITDTACTQIKVEELSFLQTITQEVSLKYQYPATKMLFKGTLRYSVSKNSKVVNFEQGLPARHLFRPLTMSTEEFGEKWTKTSGDARKHVTVTSQRSCEEAVSIIARNVHFEVIDIKGTEAILGGTVLGNDVCLLHINIVNMDIELWVKSGNKKLSEMIMNECLSACDKINKTI